MDDYDLADYAQSSIQQVLARVPGVGEVEVFGIPVFDAGLARTRTS